MRNRDVAAALFVSEKTVESHLARIYDKLGVRSRAALATIVAGEQADAEREAPRSAKQAAVAVASVSARATCWRPRCRRLVIVFLARLQRASGLTIGEPDEIDRDHGVAVERRRARRPPPSARAS